MNRAHRIALSISFAAAGTVALSGCPAQVVKEGAKSIPKASTAQCLNEKDVLEKAVEAYTLLKGEPPTSEKAMVPDFLLELSAYWDLDAKGNVVARPGKGC